MQANRFTEQKEPELAAVTHDVGGAIDSAKLQSNKNLGITQQSTQQQQQQQIAFDKNKPSVLLDKNNLVQLEPELKQEIVNHPPLHHATIQHDASAPVLSTPTDSSLSSSSSSQQSSVAQQIGMMRDSAVAKASQLASSVSVAAANLKQAASDKIEEMKQDSTPVSSTPHYIQPALKEEIVHHPALNHNTIVNDHSAPVLSVPTDRNIAPQPTVGQQLTDLKDIAAAKTAPIAASISAAASSAAASISAAASNLKQAASDKITEMKKEQDAQNAPHYIQSALKEEIINHPTLHHNTIVNDKSAPVLNVPTDHNIAPTPTVGQQLSDLKDIAVAKSAPLAASISAAASSAAASISATASNLKEAASHKIAELKKDQTASSGPHYIQPALKEEIVHHAPLTHVTDVSKDHSAPVLSAPMDSISSAPVEAAPSTASSMLSSLQHVSELVSHKAEQLLSSAKEVAHNAEQKVVDAYHSISSPSHQSTTLESKSTQSPLRHEVRHAVPQHPDIVLHPGPIDLSNVHSTLPSNLKESNLLANQSFDAKQVEVHNGGIAWSLPLEAQQQQQQQQSELLLSQQPHTVSSVSSTPNSVTYSSLTTTPSSVTYTQTTKSVETIPLSDLNKRL